MIQAEINYSTPSSIKAVEPLSTQDELLVPTSPLRTIKHTSVAVCTKRLDASAWFPLQFLQMVLKTGGNN